MSRRSLRATCRGARRSTGIVIPTITWEPAFFTTLLAIFGTTISPYLFFWQAAEEAEEERDQPDAPAADQGARAGAACVRAHPCGHAHRHGVLQPHRARDHHHRRGDAACQRGHAHRVRGAGGGGAEADRGRLRLCDLCARHHRHGAAGGAGARGLGGLRDRRGLQVAGGAFAQAEPRQGVLRRRWRARRCSASGSR